MLLSKEDQLHKFLLKKIKREIASGQSVLHLSSKQQQIKELLAEKNHYTKVESLDELTAIGIAHP
ncbi:MAG: hypothetical protein OXU45_06440, partial [Candidatus Melainabacteria bacterium]|nr:hypothetical protein [Candidatus Melainabacteria bacterium]